MSDLNVRVVRRYWSFLIAGPGLIVAALTGSMLFQAQAHAQLAVSPAGTASYSLPIDVPPGIAGMTPRLSLSFDTGAANGPRGLGWSIGGVSLISRCPNTKTLDENSRAVTFSSSDKLCLDGQRLIQTDAGGTVNATQQDDSLGGAGLVREFRTTNDSYARIRAYGIAGASSANGPAYFKVWTKSGQIYEYGNHNNGTGNAQITAQGKSAVVAWAVSRISDRFGNYIDFQYDQRDVAWGSAANSSSPSLGHEWNLAEIRYTGHKDKLPVNRVRFEYVDRVDAPGQAQDRSEGYHQGTKNVRIKLLSKIRTFVNWPSDQPEPPAGAIKVKTILLAYELGPTTGRSRPKKIVECAGPTESECLPGTTFNYEVGSAAQFAPNSAFRNSLAASVMKSGTGNRGILTGNFLGKGRSDIVRWSDHPYDNELYRNDGGGKFVRLEAGAAPGKFNITDQNLFRRDGCYKSIAADFNGDGLTDILRTMAASAADGTSCGVVRHILYRSNGDGTFAPRDINIDFAQAVAKITRYSECVSTIIQSSPKTLDSTGSGPGELSANSQNLVLAGGSVASLSPACTGKIQYDGTTSRTEGKNYHLIDANSDGLLDAVTTSMPAYSRTLAPPSEASQCAGIVCTRVYLQQTDGTFIDSQTNLAHRSVYSEPPTSQNAFFRRPFVMDVNGDGVADLVVETGIWVSREDGNFDRNETPDSAMSCQFPMDFNGDGRADCVVASGNVLYQALYVADGRSMQAARNFNLTSPGHEFLQFSPTSPAQSAGIDIGDIDGDGRADIIRWMDDPNKNSVFLSNGDGTFRPASDFNLADASNPLQKSDGSYSFVLGDFTGRGGVEILRLKSDPMWGSDLTTNVLYEKVNSSTQDQLASVSYGNGQTTTLTWVPLRSSSSGELGERYKSDRLTGNAAAYPLADLAPSTALVATLTTETGLRKKSVTEYSYAGLKTSHDGRGLLGFREMRQQNTGANGDSVTAVTQFLQSGPYVGSIRLKETWFGSLNNVGAQVLSRITYVHCDKTAGENAIPLATADVPCATSAKVKRPFLYQTTEQAWDLDGTPLPVTTTRNTYNDDGELDKSAVTVTGTPAGLPAQVSSKTLTNSFYPSNTAGDSWILGQVKTSTIAQSVPNSLGSIATTAAPGALATKGTGPVGSETTAPAPTLNWLPAVLSLLLDED